MTVIDIVSADKNAYNCSIGFLSRRGIVVRALRECVLHSIVSNIYVEGRTGGGVGQPYLYVQQVDRNTGDLVLVSSQVIRIPEQREGYKRYDLPTPLTLSQAYDYLITIYNPYSNLAMHLASAEVGRIALTDSSSITIPTSTRVQGLVLDASKHSLLGKNSSGNYELSTVSPSFGMDIVVTNTAPTIKATIPTQSVKKNASTTLNLANYFADAENDALSFTATSSNSGIATAFVSSNTLTLTGVAIGSVTVTVTASDGQLTATQSFTLNVTNTAPTVSVSSPSANVTLYENDLLNLAGSASDVDTNQSVTVYAQVNNEQRIALAVGLSNAPVPFTKQIKFVGGKLFDGETAITGKLADGIPNTLKFWAQDGDGGQSAITERTFYVVPNRPPTLTVDTVQPGGIINTDKFTITGTGSDPDKNAVTAAYKINGGNSIALEIIEGKWAFDIALAQLEVGQNAIVVELTDSYNFKVSKTIKLNKNEVKTPILQSVARYKIEPPKGSAKGVLLFVERDVDLDLKVELSMTLAGEQEQYETLTPDNTAPMPNTVGIVEDTYFHETSEPKDNIILKVSSTRPDATVNHKIHLISGAVE